MKQPQHHIPVLSVSLLRILRRVLLLLGPPAAGVLVVYFFLPDLYASINKPLGRRLMILIPIVVVLLETWREARFIIRQYQLSVQEQQRLMRLQLTDEFNRLKQRINPHFLFNSFNTLSSLIGEDRQQALKFLDELSQVYRYLLRNHPAGLSTLGQELEFIHNYSSLLKTRYGQAIQFHWQIDEGFHQHLLPSASLQLLIENAVKHNVVSRDRPLHIEVFTTATGSLVVNNTLQRKASVESGARIGLDHIRQAYRLVQEEGFQVLESEKHFMVILPLLSQIPTNLHEPIPITYPV